ncbi:VOC family protein [Phaeovulum sp. W22_SRMD_FR3]|uniref:VOC family protein n=1 Tax=Phaeovulum sp. W22_SRMD_FR3 TaxID=3240274 RepID=UPI003F9C11A5
MTEQLFVGFHHFAMRTPDLQRSITFYEALGFRQVHEWALPDYGIERAVMMQAADNKSWIEIFDLEAGIPMQGLGLFRNRGNVPVLLDVVRPSCDLGPTAPWDSLTFGVFQE